KAAIQQQLQRAETRGERQETEPVKTQRGVARLLAQEEQQPKNGGDAEWHVDEEDPAPVVDIGQVPAESRPENWTDHHARRPDRHRRAAAFNRVKIEHHRLRQRHQGGAKTTLQKAKRDFLRQRLRDAAKHRSDGETNQTNNKKRLAAKARR